MKTKLFTLTFATIALLAANAGAVEFKDTIKGSFRNYYPTAVLIESDLGTTTVNSDKPYSEAYNAESERARKGYKTYAMSLCAGKSKYAVVDNFEVHAAFTNNGTIFVTTDANIVCFDLPEKQNR